MMLRMSNANESGVASWLGSNRLKESKPARFAEESGDAARRRSSQKSFRNRPQRYPPANPIRMKAMLAGPMACPMPKKYPPTQPIRSAAATHNRGERCGWLSSGAFDGSGRTGGRSETGGASGMERASVAGSGSRGFAGRRLAAGFRVGGRADSETVLLFSTSWSAAASFSDLFRAILVFLSVIGSLHTGSGFLELQRCSASILKRKRRRRSPRRTRSFGKFRFGRSQSRKS